ncbi:hypothetical protein LguiA_019660 [Lonicera macranthoides]
MASIFGKLLKKQTPARIITTFNSPLPSPLLLNHLSQTNPPTLHPSINPNPISDPQKLDYFSYPLNSLQFYPSFPFGFSANPIPSAGSVQFGYYANPILSTGFVQFEEEDNDVFSSDSRTIWADSVKKKRKRKMNKHKLKKLRKRLRRKT